MKRKKKFKNLKKINIFSTNIVDDTKKKITNFYEDYKKKSRKRRLN